MELEALHRELADDGWRLDHDTLSSPTGGGWLNAGHLHNMPLLTLYGAMARRYEETGDTELAELLRGLAALSADFRALLTVHTDARAVFVPWCISRGFYFRAWYLGWPSLRASARHSNGGTACIEWLASSPSHAKLLGYHWVDCADVPRRSWQQIVYEGPPRDDLAVWLDAAVRAIHDSPLVVENGQQIDYAEDLPPLR